MEKFEPGIDLNAERLFGRGELSCPSYDGLVAYVTGKLPDSEHAQILDHLKDCKACAAEWARLRNYFSTAVDPAQESDEFRESLGRARARFDAFVSAQRLEAPAQSSATPSGFKAWAKKFFDLLTARQLVFATSLVVVLLSVTFYYYVYRIEPPNFIGGKEVILRGGALVPSGSVKAAPETFQWPADQAISTYQIEIFDARKNLIASLRAETNQLRLPVEVQLTIKPEQTYFWRVRFLSADGSVKRQSQVVEFTWTPPKE